MSGAPQDWLAFRESVDQKFRSQELASRLVSRFDRAKLVVDLACGTGANYRYLSSLANHPANWLGVDNDAGVLANARSMLPKQTVRLQQLDLATDVSRIPCGRNILITASAFLDLTSEAWLMEFAQHCRSSTLLVAMSVASRPIWDPVDVVDDRISDILQRHQHSDHGFGPAAGNRATQLLADRLSEQGCSVTIAETDWNLGETDSAMMELLITGISRRAEGVMDSNAIKSWQQRRRDQLRSGDLKLTVEHHDLLSIPN